MAAWVPGSCTTFSNVTSELMSHPFCHILLVRSKPKGQRIFKGCSASTFWRMECQRNYRLFKNTTFGYYQKTLAQGMCTPLLLSPSQPSGFREERAEDSTDGPVLKLTVILEFRATRQRVLPQRYKFVPLLPPSKPATNKFQGFSS